MSANGHPRTHRLLNAGDFRSVFDQVEAKAAFPQCLLLARRSKTGQARLGFIISKKNVRTAVGRNRIKRIAREVFRLNYDTLPPDRHHPARTQRPRRPVQRRTPQDVQ